MDHSQRQIDPIFVIGESQMSHLFVRTCLKNLKEVQVIELFVKTITSLVRQDKTGPQPTLRCNNIKTVVRMK